MTASVLLAAATAFATYVERITVEFASAEDAAKAEGALMALPPGKTIALVSRWDSDWGERARDQAKVLAEAGAPATFYMAGKGMSSDDPRACTNLLALGHSIGTYQPAHGAMGSVVPEVSFADILSHRIYVETFLQTCANAMALPYFNDHDALDPVGSGRSLGESFMRAGYRGSAEPWDPKINETFGAPPERWVNAVGFDWNEGDPTQAKWDQQVPGAILKAQKPDCPSGPVISLGVHAAHDPAKRRQYIPILKPFVARPEVWACGKDDYDAWRLEYLNGSVRKVSVDGAKAVFEVTRLEPWETGGKGGCAIAFTPAAKGGPVVLGMTAPHVLPTSFTLLKDGLVYDAAAKKARATFRNPTGAALTDLAFTLRLPRAWERGVRRQVRQELAADATAELEWDLSDELKSVPYPGGNRYFALQIDAVRADGTRARWYETYLERRPSERIAAPRDTCVWMGPTSNLLAEAELKATSVAGAALRDVGAEMTYFQGEKWHAIRSNPAKLRTSVEYRGTDWAQTEKMTKQVKATRHEVYLVFDVEAAADGDYVLRGSIADKRYERFVNGEGPVLGTGKDTVRLRKGANRLLFRRHYKQDWIYEDQNFDIVSPEGVAPVIWKAPK